MLSSSDILVTSAFTGLVLCSLIGNCFVIVVVLIRREMKTPVNFLIANLAVSDALFSVFLIPRFILIHAFRHPHGEAGDYMCKFLTGGNLTWTGGAASVFTLVAIASERFYAVVHPHKRNLRITKAKAKVVIGICWLMSLFLNSPLFFVSTYSEQQDFCVESWRDIDLSKAYSMSWFVLVGLIPFGFMTGAYVRVMLVLWRRNKSNTSVTRQVLFRSRNKITKIVFLVTLTYVFTWFPSLMYYAIVAYLGDHLGLGSIIHIVNQILTAFNAASNPCIYALQSNKFRTVVTDLVHGKRSTNIVVKPVRVQTVDTGSKTVQSLTMNELPDLSNRKQWSEA